MILAFLSLLIFAWFLAGYLGMSQNLRAIYVGILLAGILGALVLIPETHSFSIRMGGWAPWATISFIFGVAFLFRLFISALRNKSNEIYFADVQEADEFSNHELERYSRHIILRELGGLASITLKWDSTN